MTTTQTDYRQAQTVILYGLIDATNPGFSTLFPPGTIRFGTAAGMTVDTSDQYKRDSKVIVAPMTDANGVGMVLVKYRRIDLVKMFKNMTVSIDDWYSTTTMPFATWLAAFNKKYGLSLLASDIVGSPNITTGSPITITISPNSLCYQAVGGLSFKWVRGKRPLSSLITNQRLPGRYWTADPSDWTKPKGEFQLYGLDCSPATTWLESFTSPQGIPNSINSGIVDGIIAFLNANTGYTDWSHAPGGTTRSIADCTWTRLSLPNALVPEANSVKYNRCVIMQGGAGNWFTGKLILHYKI